MLALALLDSVDARLEQKQKASAPTLDSSALAIAPKLRRL